MGKKFAIGAIIGATVGAVAGVLTAPKSGKETREELKAKARQTKAEAELKAEKAKAEAAGKLDEAKQKKEELKTRSQNAVEGAKQGFNKKI